MEGAGNITTINVNDDYAVCQKQTLSPLPVIPHYESADFIVVVSHYPVVFGHILKHEHERETGRELHFGDLFTDLLGFLVSVSLELRLTL